jgi:hypothetical protein
MKETMQSQFISSSAASTTIAIFMFVTIAFIVLLGANKRDRTPLEGRVEVSHMPKPSTASTGPASEEKRRPR